MGAAPRRLDQRLSWVIRYCLNVIKHVDNRMVSELLSAERPPFYDVPKYQREYVWGRHDWEELLDDLLEQEGADGHFLGTFICVNREEDSTSAPRLEVIDGQQRITTISLALAAIYSVLGEHMDPADEEAFTDVVGLRRMLVLDRRSRVTPQIAGSNREDYFAVLKLAGLEISAPTPTYMGVRRIEKAYQFFRGRIESLATERDIAPAAMARDLLVRFKRAQLVKLEVSSYSDAFTLFESLNNRGKPLTPIDLIKNSLLSQAERAPGIGMDEAYLAWQQWLDNLGDDYSIQERFFRHFYNAMKDTWAMSVPRAPIATRSNLIQVYEELVNRDVQTLIERLTRGADAYAQLVNPVRGTDLPVGLNKALADLTRAEGTTAHVLLLHLLLTRDELGLSDADIEGIARLLVAFSVRRNLTNVPATHVLQRMFMEIISELRTGDGTPRQVILRRLKLVSSTDAHFLSALGGRIYEDNAAVVRFILVSLSEQGMTRENWQDL